MLQKSAIKLHLQRGVISKERAADDTETTTVMTTRIWTTMSPASPLPFLARQVSKHSAGDSIETMHSSLSRYPIAMIKILAPCKSYRNDQDSYTLQEMHAHIYFFAPSIHPQASVALCSP